MPASRATPRPAAGPREPAPGCRRCPRLAAFRREQRRAHPGWHNAPVPSFGPLGAALLVVGLAPGLRGANRTGRPFTGDHAGDLLYPALARLGFARGRYGGAPGDGFRLAGCRVTNAVRCVPPANRPTGAEAAACRGFLAAEIGAMPRLRAVLALGRVAHDAALRALGARPAAHPFAHGALHALPGGPALVDSYHCSRLNTNTGRLTEEGFLEVLGRVREAVDAGRAGAR